MSQIIKKGLELCVKAWDDAIYCRSCPYHAESDNDCSVKLTSDVLAYIETLEARLKEAEKDVDHH